MVGHPQVEVVLGGKSRETRTARVASPAERERLWPMITAKCSNYAGSRKKTEREILVVLLEVGGGEALYE